MKTDHQHHHYFMKPGIIILILSALLIIPGSVIIAGPPVKKIHAYKQASIPGMKPGLPVKTERKPSFNYLIYLEIRIGKEVSFSEIWIDGQKQKIRTEDIEHTPVTKTIFNGSGKNDTTTLVPFTERKVILVYPSGLPDNPASDSKKLNRLAKKNDLVIVYTYKGKTCFARARSIRELEPDTHV